MQPERRALVVGGGARVRPDRPDRRCVGGEAGRFEDPDPALELLLEFGERFAAGAGGRVGRGGAVQGPEEAGQDARGVRRAGDGGAVARLARDPGGDGPRAREAVGRRTRPEGARDRQREPRGEPGEPLQLLAQQLRRALGARHADGELVAEPPELVVPAAGDRAQREGGEVRVLLLEEGADGRGVEGGPGGGGLRLGVGRSLGRSLGRNLGSCLGRGVGRVGCGGVGGAGRAGVVVGRAAHR